MRVFVSEYVCGGGWPEAAPPVSLAREGRAMLMAVAQDLARVPDVSVCTTLYRNVWMKGFEEAGIEVLTAPNWMEERRLLRALSTASDATLLIAPEFEGILADRCRIVEESGGTLLGPDSESAALCSDKLLLARCLQARNVPTLETFVWRPDVPVDFPTVIKPRDGAGSQSTYLVRDANEYARLKPTLSSEPLLRNAIWQPWIAGAAVSVGLLIGRPRGTCEVFPPADQHLSSDGLFQYLGGRIPAACRRPEVIQQAAEAACRQVPGLRGYVGVDLIVPAGSSDEALVVEINPRLTTSYLGYRALAIGNLAERMLTDSAGPIKWRTGRVAFNASGRLI